MRWCVLLFLVGCTGSIQPTPYDIAVTSSYCVGDGGCMVVSENFQGE